MSDSVNIFRFQQKFLEDFEKNTSSIVAWGRRSWGDNLPEELRSAISGLGLDLVQEHMDFDATGNHFDMSLRRADQILTLNHDFYEHLRELQNALEGLAREIRSINDPLRKTQEVNATRAYLDAFLAFLDGEDESALSETPSAIPRGLRRRLEDSNWEAVSTSAQKWADTIIKILEKCGF